MTLKSYTNLMPKIFSHCSHLLLAAVHFLSSTITFLLLVHLLTLSFHLSRDLLLILLLLHLFIFGLLLSLKLHLHLELGLSVRITGVSLIDKSLHVASILLLLHFHVLHLLGGRILLLLKHLLMLHGSSELFRTHLIMLLVALRSVLDEVRILAGLKSTVVRRISGHAIARGRNGRALVSIIECFTLHKHEMIISNCHS